MEKERVVHETLQKLKEMEVDTSSQLEIVYALTMILEQYREKAEQTNEVSVFYLCDRRACDVCDASCSHTEDISHADNFQKREAVFFERCREHH